MIETIFEDIETNTDGSRWSSICKNCVKEHNIEDRLLDEIGYGCCMIKGCENEADHYIDFD
jgi:hypothetical protein